MLKKIGLTVLFFSVVATGAFAQDFAVPNTLQGGLGDVEKILITIANWMFTLLLALAVIFIILAAYRYLTSGGGEEVGKAHKMVMYAVVALAVAMLSKGVAVVVAELVGAEGAFI